MLDANYDTIKLTIEAILCADGCATIIASPALLTSASIRMCAITVVWAFAVLWVTVTSAYRWM